MKNERPHCLITMANRRFALSTEFYLHVDVPFEMFFIAIGKHDQDGHPIGYMKFTKVGEGELFESIKKTVPMFELVEVIDAHSEAPSPLISLSGVLWTRREAALAEQSIRSCQAGLDRIEKHEIQ